MHRCAEPCLIARVGVDGRLDLLERARQPERIARQLGARRIGEIFAAPRHHHRQHLRDERRQQRSRRSRRRRT